MFQLQSFGWDHLTVVPHQDDTDQAVLYRSTTQSVLNGVVIVSCLCILSSVVVIAIRVMTIALLVFQCYDSHYGY